MRLSRIIALAKDLTYAFREAILNCKMEPSRLLCIAINMARSARETKGVRRDTLRKQTVNGRSSFLGILIASKYFVHGFSKSKIKFIFCPIGANMIII